MQALLNSIAAVGAALAVPLALAGEPGIAIEKVDLPGVVNYSRLEGSSGFAGSVAGFGGATEPGAMVGLANEGYATVINIRLANEEGADIKGSEKAAKAAGLRYIHLPIDPENLAPGAIDRFLEAAGDKANQPVYIHCGSATRAGALWMIGRVLEDGWAVDAARNETEQIARKPAEAVAFATAYIASQQAPVP